MKKLIAIIFALSLVQGMQAQEINFIEPRFEQDLPRPVFSTFQAGNRYYILQKQFNMSSPVLYDMQLNVYDAAYKPIASVRLDKTLEMGDANLQNGFFVVNGSLVQFKSEFKNDGGNKKMKLFYYPFDQNGKRQKGTLLSMFPSEKAMNAGNFHVTVSKDGSKIAVFSELPFTKDANEEAILTVYDQSWTEVWKKTVHFPYPSERGPQNDIFVSNSGDVVIVKRIKVKKSSDVFAVFSFAENGKKMKEAPLNPVENFTISTYEGHFTADGKLVLAGNYYIDKKVGINVETPDGPFYALVDPISGTLPILNVSAYTGAHQNLRVVKAILKPDHSVVLVSEQVYEKSTMIPNTNFEYNYEYTTMNIVVATLDSDGGFYWEYVIKKDVKSSNDGGRFNSVVAGPSGEELQLLFKDEMNKYGAKTSPGVMGNILLSLNQDGKLNFAKPITDARIGGSGQYLFIPASGIPVSDTEWFMLAARGKELVGVQVKF